MPARVLIVDDLAFIKLIIKDTLEKTGFEVAGEASNGIEAVEQYKRLKPDIVLMDITMPRLDGISALEQIIAFDKNAKVVMVSALGKEELVKKSLLAGAKNYIVKPLDRKKVLERISASLK